MKLKTTIITSVAALGLSLSASTFASDSPQSNFDDAHLDIFMTSQSMVQVKLADSVFNDVYDPADVTDKTKTVPVCLYTNAPSGQVNLSVTDMRGQAPEFLVNQEVYANNPDPRPEDLRNGALDMLVDYYDMSNIQQNNVFSTAGSTVPASTSPCNDAASEAGNSRLELRIPSRQPAQVNGTYSNYLTLQVNPV